MSDPHPPALDHPGDISASVAENVARYRASRGLSLAKLAEASGVSRAMLNQIERRQSVPTISVLWKIATALDVPFSALIEARRDEAPTVLRADKAWTLSAQDGGFLSRALFPLSGPRATEFYALRLAPGVEERADAHATGTTENLVVHAGRVEVEAQGIVHVLEAGDALQFNADTPHVYRNPGDELAIAYLVMTYAGETARPSGP